MATTKNNTSLDPNPNRGKITILDIVKSVAVILIEAPIVLIRVCSRRMFAGAKTSFGVDFIRSMMREVSGDLPLPFKRKVMMPKNLPDTLKANRFKSCPGPLCEEVLHEDYAGFWICRGLKQTLPPKDCDLVVLYVHGGAFTLGHPLQPAVSFLRMAEIAEENGFTVAIFSLNYSLAPEAVFPTPQDQMLAAYRYIVEQEGVNPSKIVISGQSAGGYLAMSFFDSLAEQKLPKPGAAWLMYPWLDLTNSKPSVTTNEYNDNLNKEGLDRSAKLFLSDNKSAVLDYTLFDNLAATLPKYTWVTVGSHDLFLDSNQDLVTAARKGGADADIVVYEGGGHAFDATMDFPDTKRFTALDAKDDARGLMKGADHLAQGLLQIKKKLVA